MVVFLDGQAEPSVGCVSDPVPAGVTPVDALDGANRAPARPGRALAVPDGDRQQVVRRRRHAAERASSAAGGRTSRPSCPPEQSPRVADQFDQPPTQC